jgi:hypothetical protein
VNNLSNHLFTYLVAALAVLSAIPRRPGRKSDQPLSPFNKLMLRSEPWVYSWSLLFVDAEGNPTMSPKAQMLVVQFITNMVLVPAAIIVAIVQRSGSEILAVTALAVVILLWMVVVVTIILPRQLRLSLPMRIASYYLSVYMVYLSLVLLGLVPPHFLP